MKQHITGEQLKELSPEAKSKLKKWWVREVPKSHKEEAFYYVEDSYLTIGEMIEFLDKQKPFKSICHGSISSEGKGVQHLWVIECCERWGWGEYDNFQETELCDALWEAVKEVLNG